eukprot:4746351-Heterocapsa_arctica.AAC.1
MCGPTAPLRPAQHARPGPPGLPGSALGVEAPSRLATTARAGPRCRLLPSTASPPTPSLLSSSHSTPLLHGPLPAKHGGRPLAS